MFHDIIVAALAVALTAYVWYVIGFVMCRFGATNLITKLSIRNRLIRGIIFTIIGLTVVPICAAYLVVLNACVNLND